MTNALREDLARRLDPGQLAKVIGPDPLDDYQRRVLASSSPRIAICGGRQIGKSTVCSILAVAEILRPGRTVVVVAPSLRQAQLLYQKAHTLVRALGTSAPAADVETSLTMHLSNLSKLICVPGSNAAGLRGYTVDLLLVEEAARVPDDAFAACRAMVGVSRGRVVLLSSPNARTGFFWEAWSGPEGLWERYAVRSDECPRVDPAWLAEERRSLPPVIYAAEHECQFAPQGASSLFSDDDLKGMVDPRLEPLGGAWQ